MSQYVHHVPGRLRVKSSLIKGNEAEAVRLGGLLTGFKGVLKHEIKIVTGSVIIAYDTTVTQVNQLLALLVEHGYLKITTDFAPREDALSKVGASMGKVGKAVFGAALEKAVERSAMALLGAVL